MVSTVYMHIYVNHSSMYVHFVRVILVTLTYQGNFLPKHTCRVGSGREVYNLIFSTIYHFYKMEVRQYLISTKRKFDNISFLYKMKVRQYLISTKWKFDNISFLQKESLTICRF
jgi:hypothetical protein